MKKFLYLFICLLLKHGCFVYGRNVTVNFRLFLSNNLNKSHLVNETTKLDKIEGFCIDDAETPCRNYIITHGFLASGESDWIDEMKTELLKFHPRSNVFVLDWSNGSMTGVFGYGDAVQNVYATAIRSAKILGAFAKHFHKENGLINLHCIGHSLGSHVCGLTGKLMKRYNMKFKRISGLDPAGPCFEDFPSKDRLHIDDADYVDVIHTSKTLGYDSPIGHSDFYPNEGTTQPGCYLKNERGYSTRSFLSSVKLCKREIDLDNLNETIIDLKTMERSIFGKVDVFNLFFMCSHGRAYKLFTESITSPCGFTSNECKNFEKFNKGHCSGCFSNSMGFHSAKTHKPTYYYLKTFARQPFCVVKKRSEYEVCLNKAHPTMSHFNINLFLIFLLGFLFFN